MTNQLSSASRQIARAAGIVMFALALSMLIGLFRRVLIANAFGTNLEIEAFAAANRVSETLFNLVAGGALASAFIPTYSTLLTRGEKEGSWKLASAVGNLIVIILSLLTLLAAMFAPQIVRYLLAPGFSNNPFKEELTIKLLILMLPSAVIFGLSGLVMAILNSHQRFFIPALAPSMYSLGMIFGLVFLVPGFGIFGLAWGVLIGAILHLLIQLPSLIKLGGHYFATLGLKYAPVIEVARLIGPRLIGVAVVQLNFWVNVWLASYMIEGSVNGLLFAFTLLLMPQSIIAQSIAIAAMPTFSEQYARNQVGDLRNSLADSLRGILLLTIPATIGLVILRHELVVLVYQRGEFTDFSTELVSWALLFYAFGLVAHSLVEILSRAFYAMHDTKTPVFIGILAMSLNVIFSITFAMFFDRLGWLTLGGLALANSLATALEAIGLIFIMRRRLGGMNGSLIIRATVQACIGTFFMGAIIWVWLRLGSTYPNWFITISSIVVGSALYLAVLYLIRVPEIRTLSSRVNQYLKR